MKTILPNCSVKKRGGEEREPEGGRERKTERESGGGRKGDTSKDNVPTITQSFI